MYDIDFILNITCCVYNFLLKVLSHIGFMNHGAFHFLYRLLDQIGFCTMPLKFLW